MKKIVSLFAMLVSMSAAGCGGQDEPVASVEDSITSLCYTNLSGVPGVLPQNATWPINNQHIFCEHQPTSFGWQYWPPQTTPCYGNANGGQIPGPHQVDIWVTRDTSPQTHYCARVTLGEAGIYSLPWREVFSRGWLGTYQSPYVTWIQAFFLGPGTTAMASTLADVYTQGCTPGNFCTSIVNPGNSPALWWQVDGLMHTTSLLMWSVS